MNEYIEPFFSKILTGSRKNHNTHDFLLIMLENFRKLLEALENGNSVSAIFMDTLNHDLLTAKSVV